MWKRFNARLCMQVALGFALRGGPRKHSQQNQVVAPGGSVDSLSQREATVVRTRLAEPAATSGPTSAIPRYRGRAAECRTRSVFFPAFEQVQVTGGGSMQLRKSGMLALAIVAILAAAAPARAQITTGNISGTVHDAQGGVIRRLELVPVA